MPIQKNNAQRRAALDLIQPLVKQIHDIAKANELAYQFVCQYSQQFSPTGQKEPDGELIISDRVVRTSDDTPLVKRGSGTALDTIVSVTAALQGGARCHTVEGTKAILGFAEQLMGVAPEPSAPAHTHTPPSNVQADLAGDVDVPVTFISPKTIQ